MCDILCVPNVLPSPFPARQVPFTVLKLRCWQREYDQRPYQNFQLSDLNFSQRMSRKLNVKNDFRTIIRFLEETSQRSVCLVGFSLRQALPKWLRKFLQALQPVKRIELRHMELPVEFYAMLCYNVAAMRVTELNLEGTSLSSEEVLILRYFLVDSITLRTLNVSRCNLDQYNFAVIADGVHKSGSIRNFLASRLLGNGLSLDTEKITSIMGSLLMQNSLVELTMEQCELAADDMETFAEYLARENCQLLKLCLAKNHISADGAKHLMQSISQYGRLQLLDISANTIGTHGGEWVAMYFSSCGMLQHLYLNCNQMDATAVNSILLAMKKRCAVKRLQLQGNGFNARTALILRRLLTAEVLQQQEIDITYTVDGEDGRLYRIVPYTN